MSNFARHYVVGNDAPPWAVALTRGLLSALIVGALSFLSIWQTTDEVRVLVTAFLAPFLTTVVARFGLEGLIDQRKNGG